MLRCHRLPWLGLVVAVAACQRGESPAPRDRPETASLDALPPVAGHVVGPQPGPDRPLPRLDNPLAGDPAAAVDGRRLFTWFNCEGCHGGHGGGGMGPSLRDAAWIYGSRDEDIFNSIAAGRAHGMPAWGTMLTSKQIWRLVAYVTSMGTDDEPSPPPQNRSYPDPPPRRDLSEPDGDG